MPTTLCLPGWATGPGLFDQIEMPGDAMLIAQPDWFLTPAPINACLSQQKARSIDVIAFSMGAFVLGDWMSKLAVPISNVHLVGITDQYPVEQMTAIKRLLNQDKADFLRSFYKSCLPSEQDYKVFQAEHEARWIKQWPLRLLEKGLDIISTPLNVDAFRKAEAVFVYHGSDDQVAPYDTAQTIARDLSATFVPLVGRGHIPFFSHDFKLK